MSQNQEIEKLLASLLAAIQKHEQEETKKDNALIIKGLDVSFEELTSRGDAQSQLIRIHNAMVAKIDDLEERIEDLEENN